MSSDLAIRVEGLSKAYTVRHQRHDHVTLAQSALERVKHPFQRDEREEFWALKDVSFEAKQGEVLGIIGRNGAGKSTLLKLLTRITAPTKGRIDLWGRVGSLLEVGTGFHPELTGRENVYLNGSILGMRKREIDKQFDAIVDFAGVEKFLDTPVKRYSSGMYVRLAFAVAAHLETEILLLDEVLAVGDAEFQRKCIEAIRAAADGGRTALLVSHSTATITTCCNTALLLSGGSMPAVGRPENVMVIYRASLQTPLYRAEGLQEGLASISAAQITDVARPNADGSVRITLDVSVRSHQEVHDASLSLRLIEPQGARFGYLLSEEFPISGGETDVRLHFLLPCLRAGSYQLQLGLGRGNPSSVRIALDPFRPELNLEIPLQMSSEVSNLWPSDFGPPSPRQSKGTTTRREVRELDAETNTAAYGWLNA